MAKACDTFSLTISVTKTIVLSQGSIEPIDIKLNEDHLTNSQKLCYLGSIVTSNLSLDDEINARIGKAATTFGRLSKRVWRNKKLTQQTKFHVYQACVISTLPYGSQTWTSYSRQEKRLNTFHLHNLRKILNIRWHDRISNTEVLKRAKSTSIMGTLSTRRLRWLGHIRRMDNNRILKQVLFGKLFEGKRRRGRPLLRYKDKCKASLKDFSIDHNNLEKLANDRVTWKQTIRAGAKSFEENFGNKIEEKKRKRKNQAQGYALDHQESNKELLRIQQPVDLCPSAQQGAKTRHAVMQIGCYRRHKTFYNLNEISK
jgi:hypothetical protein